jgi:hypothetical protein
VGFLGHQKVLHEMQYNKAYIFSNRKSGILNIVGYLDIYFMRCVDIKVSTACYIFTLACEAIS